MRCSTFFVLCTQYAIGRHPPAYAMKGPRQQFEASPGRKILPVMADMAREISNILDGQSSKRCGSGVRCKGCSWLSEGFTNPVKGFRVSCTGFREFRPRGSGVRLQASIRHLNSRDALGPKSSSTSTSSSSQCSSSSSSKCSSGGGGGGGSSSRGESSGPDPQGAHHYRADWEPAAPSGKCMA